MTQQSRRTLAGRPEVTSHVEIEQAAFRLFAQRGFEATTMDAIAAEVAVSRRTLFRYYPSKNDIPWGQFDLTLDNFRDLLSAMPEDLPLHEAVHRGVLAFNDFPQNAHPPHRDRMRLLLWIPALQAHSVLRYSEWRAVIADFIATRTGSGPADLVPQAVGHVTLALALTAYERWLARPGADLRQLLDEAMRGLVDYFTQ